MGYMRKKEEKSKDQQDRENFTEIIKKIALGGVGAVSITQEAVSNLINSISQQIDKNKEEIINALADQFGSALRQVDITKLLKMLVSGLTVKINAEITLTYKHEKEKEK
jgi:hypothetical protein